MDPWYRERADIRDALDEGHTLRVDSVYDRSVRSYRTMLVDERDYQVATACYDGTKADRDASVRTLTRLLDEERGTR
ncbi:MAG: hypothetical protein MUE82_08065 [Chloroflexi bacterium]|jgi:hypothetical protein|nr:hypothetical protein [Chloroflexota bacterium]